MSEKNSYQDACARAETARAQLFDSLSATKARLTPARLKADVRAKAVQSVVDTGHSIQAAVKKRPVAASAAGIAFFALLVRRPLGTLFRRLFVRLRDRREDRRISETDNG
jgi:hypothetical protein